MRDWLFWLREWPRFFGPITERSKANPTQSRIAIDVELKIALSYETN